MFRFLFLLLSLGFLNPVFAQNLPETTYFDSAAYYYKERQIDRAIAAAHQATKVNYTDSAEYRLIKAYRLLGESYGIIGKANELIDSLPQALEIPVSANPFDAVVVRRYHAIGYLMKGNGNEATPVLEDAIAVAQEFELLDHFGEIYNLLGVSRSMQGDPGAALEAYNQYVQWLEAKDKSTELAFAYLNIGTIYQSQNEINRAEEVYKKALEIRRDMGDHEDVAIVYSNLGQLYSLKEEYGRALAFMDTCLRMQRRIENVAGEQLALGNLSVIQEELGNFKEALVLIRQRIRIMKNLANDAEQIIAYRNVARLLAKTNQPDSVIYFYQKSLEIAKSKGLLASQQKTLDALYSYYKAQGNFEQALAAFEEVKTLSDSLNRADARKKIAEERARFEVNEAENELEDVTEEKVELEETVGTYLGWLIALGIAIFSVLLLVVQLRRVQKQLKNQNEELVQLNAAKDRFFSIIAHDLRSPLVAFQSLGQRIDKAYQNGDAEKVNRLTQQLDQSATQLNGLLNNLLSWALLQNGLIQHRPKSIPINDVVEDNLELYQEIAQAKGIRLDSEVDTNLHLMADENALNLMMRNLLSNAIKFTPKGGSITIVTKEQAGEVFIQVKDTGLGISPEKLQDIFSVQSGSNTGTAGEKGTGLGLHLVQEVMNLHRGSVKIESKVGEGSTFTLAFPS